MKILQFPELRQTYNFDCGACALASILAYYGIDVREDRIMETAGTTKDGTNPAGISKVLAYYGLDFNMGPMSIDDVKKEIDSSYPILITLQAYKTSDLPYSECWDDGHYVIAIGYDERNLYFEDPSSYKRTWLSFIELAERWHDVGADGIKLIQWGCVIKGSPKYRPDEATHMDMLCLV